jgi:hypothetical protein
MPLTNTTLPSRGVSNRVVRRISLASILGAALIVGLSAVGPGAAAVNRCSAKDTRTLRENKYVRVYASPNRSGIRRKFDTVACSKLSGKGFGLDAPSLEYYAFIPHAISLRGNTVGVAVESRCGGEGLCATAVQAYDMRFAGTARDTLNGGDAGPRHRRLVKVGSLRVTRSGTLVWISCPEPSKSRLSGSQHPNCVRAGDKDRVYTLGASRSARLKLLDSGRTIDPSSLSLEADVATWKHGSKRLRAHLPE